MPQFSQFRSQQVVMLELIGEIKMYLKPHSLLGHEETVIDLQNDLFNKLKRHHASEENDLFPKLLNCGGLKLRAEVQKSSREMKRLEKQGDAFKEKWQTSQSLVSSPTAFIREAQELFIHMGAHFEHENRELYPAYNEVV